MLYLDRSGLRLSAFEERYERTGPANGDDIKIGVGLQFLLRVAFVLRANEIFLGYHQVAGDKTPRKPTERFPQISHFVFRSQSG